MGTLRRIDSLSMARRTPSRKRKQREQKWIEEQLEGPREPREASEGQFYVIDMTAGEKFPGLNLKETKAKWRELENAIYLSMDHFKRGKAPLLPRFDAGNLP